MDVINRQDAINSLGEEPEVWFEDDNGDYDRGMRAQWRLDVDALQAVPSAAPETSRIVINKSGVTMWHECECCHQPVDLQDAFCRGCGRRFVHE